MPDHHYPPTCRERQDAAINDLLVLAGYAQAATERVTRELAELRARVAALEGQLVSVPKIGTIDASARIPQPRMVAAMPLPSGAMMYEYATKTDPPPLYTPGYEEETP